MRIPKLYYRKREQSWFVRVHDKEIRLSGNKRDAERMRKELLEQHNWSEPHSRTKMRHLIKAYEDWLKRNRPESTWKPREGTLKRLHDFFGPAVLAEDVRPADIERWLAETLKKNPSPTTVANRISMVSTIYNWGERFELVSKNPIAKMPKPEVRKREVYLTREKIVEVLDAITYKELWQFCYFMLETGCRAQEMFVIEAKYVHLDRKHPWIVLPRDLSKGRKRQRVIYLPDTVTYIVGELCKVSPTGPIFLNSRGTPWCKDSINCALQALRERVNVPGLCATALRHSFAFHRLQQGQNPVIVSKLMGHVNTRMLEERYGHLDGSDLLGEEANQANVVPKPEDEDKGEPDSVAA